MRGTRSLSVSDPSTPSSPNFSTLNNQPSSSSSLPGTHSQFHPAFLPLLHHLSSPLHPLVSSTTGHPHPEFPVTLLAYHLLTASQLDSLAVHFHQVWPPVPATSLYPIRILPWIGTPEEKDVGLATKRRRFGQFIGLKDCYGPWLRVDFGETTMLSGEQKKSSRHLTEGEVMEMMLGRMGREWQNSLARAREEDERRVVFKRND
ncbi:hypothetical protein N7510_002401 [Penicillium lagena]|uniref:uncharacterized protein n=1 Tax=Penicillium lagena TaxID=94218 RepID=UPI0025411437|nr:uncharacterized protein N7510_002401 [Penicillium lagena]KAJ5626092.1 hypothetical protein N7510_002401 [Penicillium lagena]